MFLLIGQISFLKLITSANDRVLVVCAEVVIIDYDLINVYIHDVAQVVRRYKKLAD